MPQLPDPQSKRCPFTLPFSVKQTRPSVIDPKIADVTITIGFPCIRENCLGYKEKEKYCIPLDIEVPEEKSHD